MNTCEKLVVWKLDRLRRYLPHLMAIGNDLKERGSAFRALPEQIDTTTPHGDLLFSLFGALAQYERALTRELIMAGLAAEKRRGRQRGRPPAIPAAQLPFLVAAPSTGASTASTTRTYSVRR